MKKEHTKKLYELRAYPPQLGWERINALKKFSHIVDCAVSAEVLTRNRAFYDDKRHGNNRMARKLAQIKQCWACGLVSKKLHAHHVFLLKNGGHSDPTNIVMICNSCHGLIHGFMPTKFVDTRQEKRVAKITQDTISIRRMRAELGIAEYCDDMDSEYSQIFKTQ